MATSSRSSGNWREALSKVSVTSALPNEGRVAVPAKMTSSIRCVRRADGAWVPITHAMASTRFDFPVPFGPDDDGDARPELEPGAVGERFEPDQAE